MTRREILKHSDYISSEYNHGTQRCRKVQYYTHGDTLLSDIFGVEQVLRDLQMTATTYWQELSQSLDYTQDDGFEDVHVMDYLGRVKIA